MKEVWKDVPNYNGVYQVSNLGRVNSISRVIQNGDNFIYKTKECILKQYTSKKGYLEVHLYLNSKRKKWKVHQLVSMAFLGHTPCGMKLVVDHIDNNRTNNNVDNLQIITNGENIRKGLVCKKKNNPAFIN